MLIIHYSLPFFNELVNLCLNLWRIGAKYGGAGGASAPLTLNKSVGGERKSFQKITVEMTRHNKKSKVCLYCVYNMD